MAGRDDVRDVMKKWARVALGNEEKFSLDEIDLLEKHFRSGDTEEAAIYSRHVRIIDGEDAYRMRLSDEGCMMLQDLSSKLYDLVADNISGRWRSRNSDRVLNGVGGIDIALTIPSRRSDDMLSAGSIVALEDGAYAFTKPQGLVRGPAYLGPMSEGQIAALLKEIVTDEVAEEVERKYRQEGVDPAETLFVYAEEHLLLARDEEKFGFVK